MYKRAVTAFCVYTGLYRHYLGYDVRSEKLYQDAVSLTDKLKEKEIEARLKKTRDQRATTEYLEARALADQRKHGLADSTGDSQYEMHNLRNGTVSREQKRGYSSSWWCLQRTKIVNDEERGQT